MTISNRTSEMQKNTNVEKMNSKHGIQYTSNRPVYSFKIR